MITLLFVLPFFLSAMTIWSTFMAGSKNKNAWVVSMFSQALWLFWIVASGTWGLIPGNIAMWVVCIRNHIKWNKNNE